MWETLSADESARRHSVLEHLDNNPSKTLTLVALGSLSPEEGQNRLIHTSVTVRDFESAIDGISKGDVPASVRVALADSPDTVVDSLRLLAQDPLPEVRSAVARNLTTPGDILSTLIDDDDPNVRTGVAVNICAPPDLLTQIADRVPKGGLAENMVLTNQSLPLPILNECSTPPRRPYEPVFANVAATPEMLDRGCESKNDDCVYWTSTNPFATTEHLERIFERSRATISNPDTGSRKFEKQLEILKAVAAHNATSDGVISFLPLLMDSSFAGADIIESALRKRRALPYEFWSAVEGQTSSRRRMIAQHPKCPEDIRSRLKGEEDPWVWLD